MKTTTVSGNPAVGTGRRTERRNPAIRTMDVTMDLAMDLAKDLAMELTKDPNLLRILAKHPKDLNLLRNLGMVLATKMETMVTKDLIMTDDETLEET